MTSITNSMNQTVTMPAEFSLVCALVKASECPHEGENETMKSSMSYFTKDDKMFCVVILKPDRYTEKALKYLTDELGSLSQSLYNGRSYTKGKGTGEGLETIKSHICPYLINTETNKATCKANDIVKHGGFFFDHSIQEVVMKHFNLQFAQHPKVLGEILPKVSIDVLNIVSDYSDPTIN